MANQVILIIIEGPDQGKRFEFEEAKVLRFGRASDCDVRFKDDRRMSRYHCEVEIDPPQAQIYDLGSLHGTLVNEKKYGGRTERKVKKTVPKRQHPPVVLQDGDKIRVGRNLIQVEIQFEKTPLLDSEEDVYTLLDDELDETIIVNKRSPSQRAAQPDKTVVEQRNQAHDPDKTIVESSTPQPHHVDEAKTIVDASTKRKPSHYQSQTVVASPVRQPAHDPNKTIVERAQPSLPAHDLNKTIVEPAQPSSPAHDPAAKPIAHTPPQNRRAKALGKTVMIDSPKSKSAAEEVPTRVAVPVRSVLTPEQQEARGALLELLKDLGLKALNQDANLGSYVIERRLGRGGFGKVFQARHRMTQERVAIKIMRPRAAVNNYVRESFKREIDNTRRLFHTNIVQLLEDGVVGNMFYFMMEYCEAGNANQLRRKRGGKIPLAEALPIMKQILQGLSFIHERGYIHRDLKPDNILLTNTLNGTVAKIADLGLTKGFLETGMNGGLTITGVRIGTGPYMSREQLTNFKYVEPVSDVWSIGATFYVMLTGQRPRQGPPNLKNYDLVLKGRIIPIRTFEPSIPIDIANIIDRALIIDTKKRYETATEMLNALEQVA